MRIIGIFGYIVMVLFLIKASQMTTVRSEILRRGYGKSSPDARELYGWALSCYFIASALAILSVLFIYIANH